ncbi:MAG: hypothetical protein ABJC79_16265 [Acidimicrobiia bacterium]
MARRDADDGVHNSVPKRLGPLGWCAIVIVLALILTLVFDV